jgi:adenosylcobinamide-phosphate synthase
MSSLMACIAGMALDAIFGDPVWLYHPVRIIGNWISILEKWLRVFCKNDEKKERIAGCVLWFGVVIASVGIPWGLLYLAGKVSFWLQFALETFWCYQLLAGKCLKDESRKVYVRLVNHNLEGARHAVSMIVGRDTGNLSEAGVTKAAVETVAENTSDGVIAPLIFMLIGGVPLGFFYKAVNTMDSMVGYKNEKYLHFGRFAAKMDDVWNYIPSRISALLMIASAWIFRMDYKRAWAVWKRDRRKHASPNSAQTEAVCAGALQVQLAGDAYYFGKLYEKPTIGDPIRLIESEDIRRANRLLYATAITGVVLFLFIRIVLILCWS